jgi:hypothetical protein
LVGAPLCAPQNRRLFVFQGRRCHRFVGSKLLKRAEVDAKTVLLKNKRQLAEDDAPDALWTRLKLDAMETCREFEWIRGGTNAL